MVNVEIPKMFQEKRGKLLGAVVVLGILFCVAGVSAVMIGPFFPAGSGRYSQWLTNSSIGMANYKMVREVRCDGNNSYVFTNTTGRKDSYNVNISAIPVGAVIRSIIVTPCVSQNTEVLSGTQVRSTTVDLFYIFNGVEYQTFRYFTVPAPLRRGAFLPTPINPVTLPGVNLSVTPGSTFEIGVDFSNLSATHNGVRLSNIAVEFDYDIEIPPLAPINLVASNLTQPAIVNVRWTDSASTEDGFSLERSSDNVTFTEIANVGSNTTLHTDAGTNGIGLPARTYYYRVRAYNNFGFSSYSNTASVVVPVIPQ